MFSHTISGILGFIRFVFSVKKLICNIIFNYRAVMELVYLNSPFLCIQLFFTVFTVHGALTHGAFASGS